MIKTIVVLMSIALTGCATSSGVLKTGADTYTVSTAASYGGGGLAAAKKSAYDQANQKCEKMGQTITNVNEKAGSPTWTDGMYSINLTFRCVAAQ